MGFPTSPVLNQTFTIGNKIYNWNGSAWVRSAGLAAVLSNIGPVGDRIIPATANTISIGNNTSRFKETYVSQINSNNLVIGSVVLTNNYAMVNNANIIGRTYLEETIELMSNVQFANSVVTHNFNEGSIFFHNNMTNNFTADFTNVPTTNERAINITLILKQGGTAYLCNAVRIGGVTQTINYANGTVQQGSSGNINVQNFSLIRTGGAWTVLSTISSYQF